ncbi:MAG TPA: hypothetical protein ENH82_11065 [bacterium]|nr:hypothetical protein [bacterium]
MIAMREIVAVVAEYFKCEPETVIRGYGERAILQRQIAMLLCRNLGGYRNFEIAEHFNQDKRVVSYSIITMKKKLKEDRQFGNYNIRTITRNIFKTVLQAAGEDKDINQAQAVLIFARLRADTQTEETS